MLWWKTVEEVRRDLRKECGINLRRNGTSDKGKEPKESKQPWRDLGAPSIKRITDFLTRPSGCGKNWS